MNPIEMLPCAGGLYIERDPHKAAYESVAEYCEGCSTRDDFADDEEFNEAVETNSFWTLIHYPDTPIGSYRYAGPTLEGVLRRAISI